MLTLLVIYCNDIEESKVFYECLGFTFVKEKHGSGPLHYSTYMNGLLLEIFPQNKSQKTNTRLGFKVESLETIKKNIQKNFPNTEIKESFFDGFRKLIITDLNENKIELYE